MHDPSPLGHLVLGHSPIIDRHRAVIATRLTVFPELRDTPPDTAALLHALLDVWPAPAEALDLTLRPLDKASAVAATRGAVAGPVSLNVASEAMLDALLLIAPPPHVMIEVPAFMACDPARSAALHALSEAGSTLLIKGRPVVELPREILSCFRHSIIDVGEERRSAAPPPDGVARTITHVQAGVRTRRDVDEAFQRGAVAVIGWPNEDEFVPARGSRSMPPDLQVVMELIKRVDREEPVDKLEAVLSNDPSLAFRLLRYINSAAFGLRVEISSFRHALMMLGYQKLKRWLALLLSSASKDPAARPLMFASVRRGLVMEELVRAGGDTERASELFICGVFSLLDRMLQQPFDELFKSVPVPESVRQALVDRQGPFLPYLDVACALEQNSRSDTCEAAERAFLSLAEVNAALLRALAGARELD